MSFKVSRVCAARPVRILAEFCATYTRGTSVFSVTKQQLTADSLYCTYASSVISSIANAGISMVSVSEFIFLLTSRQDHCNEYLLNVVLYLGKLHCQLCYPFLNLLLGATDPQLQQASSALTNSRGKVFLSDNTELNNVIHTLQTVCNLQSKE
jgi:hypothetical protein